MSIDKQMNKVVEFMRTTSEQISTKSKTDGQRPWMNFSTVEKAGKFEFSKVAQIFTRNDSNDTYLTTIKRPQAEDKETKTAKLSADFLAGCERDYRLRTRSRVRSFVHATIAYPAAQGSPAGPLQTNTLGWLGRVQARERKDS